jgi:uncharacterized protein (DUF885 family)
MRTLAFIALLAIPFMASAQSSDAFNALVDRYYHQRMELMPIEATFNGDTLHNDKLPADFTDSYRARLRNFFIRYETSLRRINRKSLTADERITYDVLRREMYISLDGLSRGLYASWVIDHQYIPFQQFDALPLLLVQLGSGEGVQPFKNIRDYDNWLKRANAFPAWADSAILYFRKGIAHSYVLPEALVRKMIPQMSDIVVTDVKESIFYGPVKKMPAYFPQAEKARLGTAFATLIEKKLHPAYTRLHDFLEKEYLLKARKTTGVNAVPGGADTYKWMIRFWTTTNKTPEAIYATGLSEVARIKAQMDSVRIAVGIDGDLKSFFTYMKTDPKFKPFKKPEEVLNAYRSILARITPNLPKLFSHTPKTAFEVRQTEAFRAASASAEYYAGTPEGRPGIFYVPIVDATKYNVTTGMEGLFLHEAIPGHHFQISLQNENKQLPLVRRFISYGATVEGWGLYSESLGKELGLYTDPYQYMGALGKEMHRAIRLVVDVGMHTGKLTREEAITYMMANMPLDERGVIAEIERYMSRPGQALCYKIGALKIQELRARYQQQLGSRFSIIAFHDRLLEIGGVPLEILEKNMDEWALGQAGK